MRLDEDGEFWNIVIGAAIGAVVGGILGGITASKNGQNILTGVLTGAALGAGAGAIIGSGNVAAISGGVSSVASKATTDLIGMSVYGTEPGTWEDYATAFVFGGITGSLGGSTFQKTLKTTIDVVARPGVNQLVKLGTQGKNLDGNKYLYDVATRFATSNGSNAVIKGNILGLDLKVDVGKCFYRTTFRWAYQHLS